MVPCGFVAFSHYSPLYLSSHSTWCFPCVSFKILFCLLVRCLGNNIFLVVVSMGACKYSIPLVSWKWEMPDSLKVFVRHVLSLMLKDSKEVMDWSRSIVCMHSSEIVPFGVSFSNHFFSLGD